MMLERLLRTSDDTAALVLRLVLAIVVALLIKGGGRWSLDGVLARRASRRA